MPPRSNRDRYNFAHAMGVLDADNERVQEVVASSPGLFFSLNPLTAEFL